MTRLNQYNDDDNDIQTFSIESSRVRVSSLRIESMMRRWNSGGTTCAETCPLPLRDGAVACGALTLALMLLGLAASSAAGAGAGANRR